MTAVVNLKNLIANMHPKLSEEVYVFCSLTDMTDTEIMHLKPLCIYKEAEGTTIIINKHVAIDNHFDFDEDFKRITLEVHSSLNAVGLTAAVTTALTDKGISANVIAAYYHDHIFVPSTKANLAMTALIALSKE